MSTSLLRGTLTRTPSGNRRRDPRLFHLGSWGGTSAFMLRHKRHKSHKSHMSQYIPPQCVGVCGLSHPRGVLVIPVYSTRHTRVTRVTRENTYLPNVLECVDLVTPGGSQCFHAKAQETQESQESQEKVTSPS